MMVLRVDADLWTDCPVQGADSLQVGAWLTQNLQYVKYPDPDRE